MEQSSTHKGRLKIEVSQDVRIYEVNVKHQNIKTGAMHYSYYIPHNMRSKWTPTPEKYQLHKLDYGQSGMMNHFTVNCYVICHKKTLKCRFSYV